MRLAISPVWRYIRAFQEFLHVLKKPGPRLRLSEEDLAMPGLFDARRVWNARRRETVRQRLVVLRGDDSVRAHGDRRRDVRAGHRLRLQRQRQRHGC